jgi:two-component system nitrogen regulation response regulator GlnG
MPHLLVVDDEQSICWAFSRLAKELNHSVSTAASAEQGLEEARRQRPDVVVLDVRLPGMDGITAVGRFRELLGNVPVIVITAYGELETAVAAVRSGAFEYLVKPLELAVAQRVIQRALSAPATSANGAGQRAPAEAARLVGKSAAMQEVFKKIALVAPSDACVHIQGESGVGKELVARAIHRYSARAEGPFVPVNLASLSPSLAESELFGHARGAFTGADQPRKGLLEQASGGIIFLDEVADVPWSTRRFGPSARRDLGKPTSA